ncbi:MAG: PilZ domain-containing protein [Methylococcales bacterium]|nr:PilZ domain-containing protein [Methylococcales bacterium]
MTTTNHPDNRQGQLHMAGEMLSFHYQDVSVQGMTVNLQPGRYLQTLADFERAFAENPVIEFYLEALALTGVAEILWLRSKDAQIEMGMEFKETLYNANRLWRHRRFYRRPTQFTGQLQVNGQYHPFQGENISADGMLLSIPSLTAPVLPGTAVQIDTDLLANPVAGIVCWSEVSERDGAVRIGLRYLAVST